MPNKTQIKCADCKSEIGDEDFATEINPEGGYGQGQVIVCDACMQSGRWEYWKSKHWPNWPRGRGDHA